MFSVQLGKQLRPAQHSVYFPIEETHLGGGWGGNGEHFVGYKLVSRKKCLDSGNHVRKNEIIGQYLNVLNTSRTVNTWTMTKYLLFSVVQAFLVLFGRVYILHSHQNIVIFLKRNWVMAVMGSWCWEFRSYRPGRGTPLWIGRRARRKIYIKLPKETDFGEAWALLHPVSLKYITQESIGSIISRCSGNEPALLD